MKLASSSSSHRNEAERRRARLVAALLNLVSVMYREQVLDGEAIYWMMRDMMLNSKPPNSYITELEAKPEAERPEKPSSKCNIFLLDILLWTNLFIEFLLFLAVDPSLIKEKPEVGHFIYSFKSLVSLIFLFYFKSQIEWRLPWSVNSQF